MVGHRWLVGVLAAAMAVGCDGPPRPVDDARPSEVDGRVDPDTGSTLDSGGALDSGGMLDSGADARAPDAPSSSRRAIALVTSGGGVTSSGRFRMRVSIGAPSPAGEATGGGRMVRIGPGVAP